MGLNAAARVVCEIPKFDHISPILKELHRLSVRYRVEFNIALPVFKVLHGKAPAYLENLLRLKDVGTYRLRSSGQKLVLVPRKLLKHLEIVPFSKPLAITEKLVVLNVFMIFYFFCFELL